MTRSLLGTPIQEARFQRKTIVDGLRKLAPHVATYSEWPHYNTWLYRGAEGGDTPLDYPQVLAPGAPMWAAADAA